MTNKNVVIQADSSMQLGIFVRGLGTSERMFSLMHRNRPTQFAVAAEIEGDVTAENLRTALGKVQERHALLRVSIQTEQATPAFYDAQGVDIPLRVIAGKISPTWEREIETELSEPIDPTCAPLLRAVLLQEPGRAVVLLTAHHAVTDGISMTFVIRDLLQALAGETLAALPVPPSKESLLAEVPEEPLSAAPPPPGSPATYVTPGTRPHIARLRLDAALTAKLRERARREGATVHGALCASIALAGLAASSRWQHVPVRVAFPVDMRKQLGAGEANTYLISGGGTAFAQEASPHFWDWARSAKEPIAKARGLKQARQLSRAVEQMLQGDPDASSFGTAAAQIFAAEAILSNLGEISYGTRFGQLKLAALWGPALLMGFAETQTIGAATVNGQLCLLLANYELWPEMLPGMERVLHEACAED